MRLVWKTDRQVGREGARESRVCARTPHPPVFLSLNVAFPALKQDRQDRQTLTRKHLTQAKPARQLTPSQPLSLSLTHTHTHTRTHAHTHTHAFAFKPLLWSHTHTQRHTHTHEYL